MAGYTKLFSSIVTSTIWCQDNPTRIVWVTMLAMSDAYGRVEGSIPGFAHIARVTVQEMRNALEILRAPDPDSRTPENEGRRIEDIHGGWRILNYSHYREFRDPEARRAQNREAKARQRDREKPGNVIMSADVSTKSAQAKAEAVQSLGGHKPPPCVSDAVDSNSPNSQHKNQNGQEIVEPRGNVLALAGLKLKTGVPAAPRPYSPREPLQVVMAGLKVRMGVPLDDRAWDKANYGRWAKYAKGILEQFHGEVGDALKCIDALADYFEAKKLDWSPRAITDWAFKYKNGSLSEAGNENHHR